MKTYLEKYMITSDYVNDLNLFSWIYIMCRIVQEDNVR